MRRLASSYEESVFRRLTRNPEDPGCQLSYSYHLYGKLDIAEINSVLRHLIAWYCPDFLGRFIKIGDYLYVYPSAMPEWVLEFIEYSHENVTDNIVSGQLELLPERLFRFTLACISPELYHLRMTFSHLVFDGVSYRIFFDIFAQLYRQRYRLDELPDPLARVLPELVGAVDSELGDASRAFWRERLATYPLGQHLPFLKSAPSAYTRFLSARRSLVGTSYQALLGFVEASGSTLFRLILASTAVTLCRYMEEGESDGISIAHTINARTQADTVGCFTQVIPLWIPCRPEWSLLHYLRYIDEERRKVKPHQGLPLSEILALADKSLNRNNPLVNVVVNFSEGLLPTWIPDLEGLEVEQVETPSTGGPFDLGITFNHDADGLYLSVDMPKDLTTEGLVNQWADHLLLTLQHFVENSEIAVHSIDFKLALRPVARGGVLALSEEDSVASRVIEQARLRPEKTAIRSLTQALSYAQLARYTEHLLRCIRNTVDDEALQRGIGLLLERTHWLPLSMLAALRLRVPFVPLEASLPEQRIEVILATTQLSVLLSDGSVETQWLKTRLPSVRIIELPENPEQLGGVVEKLAWAPHGNEHAYILFTSGSTGVPKGVALTQRNLLNFMLSMALEPGFCNDDHFLALTPISFDISILELLLPLFVGGTLEIVEDSTRRSAVALSERINASRANVVQATPATWRMLKNALWSCDRPLTLLCGGEVLTAELAEFLLGGEHVLYNMYGPTEATIWASCFRVTVPQAIYLGRPILNTEFYIVGSELNPIAIGKIGELLIRGECVAPGYFNVDSSDEFIQIEGIDGRLYRSGDIVRLVGDGQILYVGRRDNQRKLNGHRIELDDINARLMALLGDCDLFTVVREGVTPCLFSFYWAGEDYWIDEQCVLQDLSKVLPSYMLPSGLFRLRQVPLTINGKVDLKRLATEPLEQLPLSISESVERSKVPLELEKGVKTQLRAIFRRYLGVDVRDPYSPLGWLGLNSISYNLLSQALQNEMGVLIAPHQFYSLNTLVAVCQETEKQLTGRVPISVVAAQPVSAIRSDQRIAIIGYAVLMPANLEAQELWRALLDKQNLVNCRMRPGFTAPLHAGFLDNIEGFDAKLFSISPLEAKHMDPRQRLLLQTAWRALEDSGYAPQALAGTRTGCYIGATGADYATLQARCGATVTPYSLIGNSLSILANRLSSFFDWTGPSFTLDTACSGSLSALAKACQDLVSGICDMALAGGINVIADDQIFQGLQAGNFMSPTFRCASFDSEADGYVRGEGVGCFLLKTLTQAQLDGDAIHGVIIAHGENHGGRANSLTAPKASAQAALLTRIYAPELVAKVSYIETHGTGTLLGDPIEIDALKSAWSALCPEKEEGSVWLGALKTNIGHLEAAAGAASLAKVLLAIEHGQLPPNNHFKSLNPYIDLRRSPFAILTHAQPWSAPRVAGISSFGFGGANAHLVVGEAPPQEAVVDRHSCYLVTLSAASEAALRANRSQLQRFLEEKMRTEAVNISLEQIAFTCNTGRNHFDFRLAWVVCSLEEFIQQLALPSHTSRVSSISSLTAQNQAVALRFEQLIRLREKYLQGGSIDWKALHKGESCQRLHLPTYRFEERNFWFDSRPPQRS